MTGRYNLRALLALIVALPVLSGSPATGRAAAQDPSAFTGTWEARGQVSEPWLFRLQANGNKVTGHVWQDGGLSGASPIFDGVIDGTNITFKYRNFSRVPRAAQFFPNLAPLSAGQARLSLTLTITLTGVLQKDEIVFTSRVDDPDRVGFPGRPPTSQVLANPPPVVAREMGAFGSLIANTFIVRRGAAAVVGKVVVDEASVARPVFKLHFTNAAGQRTEPAMRDVWSAPPPRTLGEATEQPLRFGSPFDAVPRFDTTTLPGNPAEFVVRLPPGTYRATVTDLPAGYTLKSIRSGAEDITTTNLVVGADRLSPELTVVLGVTPGAPWSRVVGKVGNVTTRVSIRGGPRGGQTPTPPTAVVLISQSFSEYWLAPIGPGGQFEFARIQPGNYEVRMFPDSQVTPALNLTVPPSAALEIELQAPDVTPLPCPSC